MLQLRQSEGRGGGKREEDSQEDPRFWHGRLDGVTVVKTGTAGGGGAPGCWVGLRGGTRGEQSPHLSPTGIFSLWDRGAVQEYFGVSWLVAGGMSIKGTMGVSQELLWERTHPSRVR